MISTLFLNIFLIKKRKVFENCVDGINDLINTAPTTLSTQFKKISKITIDDKINKKKTEYSNRYSKSEIDEEGGGEIGMNTITTKSNNKEEKKYFYSYKTNICMLLYEVEKNDKDAFIVGEKKKNQPTLYRDFPLIGSEKFHFPFFLDGFRFNPLETRNGLYLNGDSNEEAIENRNIIGESVKYSIYFTKYLIEQNLNKRYLLAQSKIPEPPQRYDSIAIKRFTESQKNWRTELVKLRLVKDRKGSTYNRLNSLKLPLFKEKFNIDFFNLFAKLNVTCENIPTDEEAKIWYNILEEDPLKKVYGIEENTWNFKYALTEIDLLKTIKEYGSIIKYAEIMNTDAETIISWLNELYTFLQKNDCMNYLFEYEIIPNKKGEFRKVDDLCRCDKEKNNLIPDIIEPIYNYIFGKEINEIYVHKDIIFNSYEKYFKKKNFKHILN